MHFPGKEYSRSSIGCSRHKTPHKVCLALPNKLLLTSAHASFASSSPWSIFRVRVLSHQAWIPIGFDYLCVLCRWARVERLEQWKLWSTCCCARSWPTLPRMYRPLSTPRWKSWQALYCMDFTPEVSLLGFLCCFEVHRTNCWNRSLIVFTQPCLTSTVQSIGALVGLCDCFSPDCTMLGSMFRMNLFGHIPQ